ncbi:nuclear transport factor 2 family protein [Mycobacterium sp. NPDC050041]|uniref:nuclear transport factor 2 family protein n=1 Tax=Mycobacterium sp. NPDC050041 TaxID=3364293 RepID=UPI003C2AFA8D
MTLSSNDTNEMAGTIRRYVGLLATGSADELLELFAEDATVEDPVGSEVRTGRQEIHQFFSALEAMDRQTELGLLRIVGQEAAFDFTINFKVGDTRMSLQPIDTMTFNASGEITSLRSYFAPTDVTSS